jgi:hypothetical protein
LVEKFGVKVQDDMDGPIVHDQLRDEAGVELAELLVLALDKKKKKMERAERF